MVLQQNHTQIQHCRDLALIPQIKTQVSETI